MTHANRYSFLNAEDLWYQGRADKCEASRL